MPALKVEIIVIPYKRFKEKNKNNKANGKKVSYRRLYGRWKVWSSIYGTKKATI